MSAFNALNGVPAPATPSYCAAYCARSGLRRFVVSDWNARRRDHQPMATPADSTDAAVKSLRAGVDMEMASTDYYDRLPALIAPASSTSSW